MAERPTCSLHISLTDSDYSVARLVLPHQLRQLAGEVDAVVVSVNRNPPTSNDLAPLDRLLDGLADEYSNLRWAAVDYSEVSRRWVNDTLFGGIDVPHFDYKGTPIHAFLEYLRTIETEYVFHLDADMLLGGSYEGWVAAATAELVRDPSLFAANPLGGPPHPDGWYEAGGSPIETPSGPARLVTTLSTRIYLARVETFTTALSPLEVRPPREWKGRLRPYVMGTSHIDLPERLMTDRMIERSLRRIDLGGPGGAWSLHPDYKTPQFVAQLATLVDRVERGDLPDGQLGRFDVQQALVPVTDLATRRQKFEKLARRSASHWWSRRPGARP